MPGTDTTEADPAVVDDATVDVSTDDSGADVAADGDEKVDGEEALGDAGKQALDRTKQKLKDERAARRALEAEIAALKAGTPAEGESVNADALREQLRAEIKAEADLAVTKAEIKAAAAGKLIDPADALTNLDPADLVGADADDLADAIDELIKRKPYLAVTAQGGPRFKGTADGGTRKETRPSQLSRADLAGMSPEAIEEARVAGRLDDLLSGKHS